MTHWAIDYVGLPWAFGAQGPEAYDCWNFVREVQKTHYGLELPTVEYTLDWRVAGRELEANAERDNWVQIDKPADGCVALMARSKLPVHIGVVIKANGRLGVLHCLQGAGVVFHLLTSLPGAGWGRLTYFVRRPA